jgi:hypothetical protein
VCRAENVSKVALLYRYKEDVSRDIEGVQLQSLSALFVFRVGIKGILVEDVPVTGNLHSDMGSEGSQQN